MSDLLKVLKLTSPFFASAVYTMSRCRKGLIALQPDDEIISRALANDQGAIDELFIFTIKRIRPSLRAKFSGDLKEEIDDGIDVAFMKF